MGRQALVINGQAAAIRKGDGVPKLYGVASAGIVAKPGDEEFFREIMRLPPENIR